MSRRAAARTTRTRTRTSRAVIAVAAATYAFLHAPMLVLVVFSFNASKYSTGWTGATLHWYARLLEQTEVVEALGNSLAVALVSTVLSTLLGTSLALALHHPGLPARRAWESALYLPVVAPEIVVGISLLVGFVLAGVPLGLGTITLAHTAFEIPFVAVVVHARLVGMDRALEEAALSLGADELTAFVRVTLPRLWPAIAAGAMLAFVLSIDDYVITSFVAGPSVQTLPLVVCAMVRRNIEPSINAISTIVLVATTALAFAADRLGTERPWEGK
jgi:spermidine/putrescine transport system permease protein